MNVEVLPLWLRHEVQSISTALASRADSSYLEGMRRTVPSEQPAHAVRVPEIRKVAAAWSRAHKDLAAASLIAVAEALWSTGWREERIAAMAIVARSRSARAAMTFDLVERWSAQIDNWELVDNLAGPVASGLLRERPGLLPEVASLAGSANPWQRRLAIVTLIEAARRDARWLAHLEAMSKRLAADEHRLVRKAVAWAGRVIQKRTTLATGD